MIQNSHFKRWHHRKGKLAISQIKLKYCGSPFSKEKLTIVLYIHTYSSQRCQSQKSVIS